MTANRQVICSAILAALSLETLACSSSDKKHFEQITPGMTEAEVKKTMSDGPSRFENIANTPYTSWYWGDEYCVLFNQGKVVSKDAATEGRNASVAGGSYEEKRLAQCLAPGQEATAATERTVNIPGVGKITLPRAKASQATNNKPSGG